jgi:hypothetical protein
MLPTTTDPHNKWTKKRGQIIGIFTWPIELDIEDTLTLADGSRWRIDGYVPMPTHARIRLLLWLTRFPWWKKLSADPEPAGDRPVSRANVRGGNMETPGPFPGISVEKARNGRARREFFEVPPYRVPSVSTGFDTAGGLELEPK